MYEFRHEQDTFVKAEQVKGLIRAVFGQDMSHRQIQKHLANISHNHYHNTKISQTELEMKQILDKYKLCYRSAYRWLRATQLPEDVKEEIQRGNMSLTKAFKVNQNLTKRRKASLGLQILEMGRAVINKLED